MKDFLTAAGFDTSRAPITSHGKMAVDLLAKLATAPISAQMGRGVMAAESMSESDSKLAADTFQRLYDQVESSARQVGFSAESHVSQTRAAAVAGLMASNHAVALNRSITPFVSTESIIAIAPSVPDAFFDRTMSVEQYDNTENARAMMFSVEYNFAGPMQSAFGETLFPTITIRPDEAGIIIDAMIRSVYNGVTRDINGKVANYNKKPLVRAIADHTVLHNDLTRMYPIVRGTSVVNFVDATRVAPRTFVNDGENVTTAPLATGVMVDYAGLCQTDAMLSRGVANETDSIFPSAVLQKLVVEVGDDTLEFSTKNFTYNQFVRAQQGKETLFSLTFNNDAFSVAPTATRADGTALSVLKPLVDGKFTVRLALRATGLLDLEAGSLVVDGNAVSIVAITNQAGEQQPLTSAAVADIVAAFKTAKIIGYEIETFYSNLNHARRGQLIDTMLFRQAYNVPLRSPITSQRPYNSDGSSDQSDMDTLISTTQTRIANSAVTALIEYEETMATFTAVKDINGNVPEGLGIGGKYVIPTHKQVSVDVSTIIQNNSSDDLIEDLKATLVNVCRDMAIRLYYESEYGPAMFHLYGAAAPEFRVIIATDDIIAQYINMTGDNRTLSPELKAEIIHSRDNRMKDKIFITFGIFGGDRNTRPLPLNFGNLLWAPEVTGLVPMTRDGRISKEQCVQPRYLNIINLPVIGRIDVKGIEEVIKAGAVFRTRQLP